MNPVGGAITDASKSLGVGKKLQPQDGMVVEFLPFSGNGFCCKTGQVGSQVIDLNPWQNEVSSIVSQQVAIPLPGFRRPADKAVATLHAQWR